MYTKEMTQINKLARITITKIEKNEDLKYIKDDNKQIKEKYLEDDRGGGYEDG